VFSWIPAFAGMTVFVMTNVAVYSKRGLGMGKALNKAFLILVLVLFFPFISFSEEIYEFERMWPALEQPWYFNHPSGIALDSSGNVYVADTLNDRIQKFTAGGQLITIWGNFGNGDGQFHSPGGVAIDGSSSVYVAELDGCRVQKFTSTGQFITKWGSAGSGDGQFISPSGIAIDSSGNVYVTDSVNNRIQKFTSGGQSITKWGSSGIADGELNFPSGIAIDSSGYVYIADSSNFRIQKFTSSGQFIAKWGSPGSGNGQFNMPHGLAIDNSSNVYVNDTDRIQKFTSNGQFITKWGKNGINAGEFSDLEGIAIGLDGKVYVSDSGNHRIQVFSKGTLHESVSNPNTPSGSVIGKIGVTYKYSTGGSTSSLGHSVEYQFDWRGDGSDLSSWGSASQSKTWTAAGTYNVKARARCSQDVSVLSDWSNSLSVSISLPDILVTPLAYDFGNVEMKKSKTASFKGKNNGMADLLITTSVTGTDISMFTITSGGGVSKTIKPGKTLTIKVVFKPTSAGSKSSTLRITSNDPDTPAIDIPLTGAVPFSVKINDIHLRPASGTVESGEFILGAIWPPTLDRNTFAATLNEQDITSIFTLEATDAIATINPIPGEKLFVVTLRNNFNVPSTGSSIFTVTSTLALCAIMSETLPT
jgi:sugar lactone lactonase YvrE